MYCFSIPVVFSQTNQINNDIDKNFKTGLELYNLGKYSIAQEHFNTFVKNSNDKSAEIYADANYYSAMCALILTHPDGDEKLQKFITAFPESQKIKPAKFELGNYYYGKKRFESAIAWYSKVDVYDLSDNKKVSEYYFKLGYSYFTTKNFDKAATNFYEIKDAENEYMHLANYYYSHISYEKGNYETALKGFKKLSVDARYAKIVPFYIIQIYYLQGNYDKVVESGKMLLDTVQSKRDPEISKLVGDSYYKLKKNKEAQVYLEKWQASNTKISAKDQYQLAYITYLNGEYDKAIDKFERILYADDDIAQYAYYHIGQCYLKTDRKKHARSAFNSAASFDFDEKIKEDALYNSVKLSYETSYDVFNESIKASKEFLKLYPKSDKYDEVSRYMYTAFFTTKNYKGALEIIESMNLKDQRTLEVYQRINYLKAIELYNNLDIKESGKYFDQAIKYPQNKSLAVQAKYWKAEGSYRMKNYNKAIEEYKDFVYTPWAINLPNFSDAYYNIGYAYFMVKDYNNATVWFRKKLASENDLINKKKIINDTYIRLADSYFALRNFKESIEYYNKSIVEKSIDIDYALYQKGTAEGLLLNHQSKISTLQSILSLSSKSPYKDDAVFDIAKSYLVLGKKDSAIVYFDKLNNSFPESKLQSKSLLGKALVLYDLDLDSAALVTFKKVVEKYPATAQAKEALVGLKNIYIDKGEGSAYLKYIEGLSYANVAETSQDSILYQSAEARYFKGDYKNASNEFATYLKKFPNGFFALNANFYKAECSSQFFMFDEAIVGYKYVINEPFNSFSESSLAQLSTIYHNNNQFDKAIESYTMLEKIAEKKSNLINARVGLMRIYFNTLNYKMAIEYAQKLISDDYISNENLYAAYLTKGKSLMGIDDYNEALKVLQLTSKMTKSVIGAEAKYHTAYIYHLQQDYKASETTIFEIVNDVPAYDYWIAKGFILLADNYFKLGDTFQAEHTLKSIIENYNGDELRLIAQKKLNEMKAQTLVEEVVEPKEETIDVETPINYDNLIND